VKISNFNYTRKKVQVVTDLQTSCNKVVVKPILGCVRTACSSCCDKSGTIASCYHFVSYDDNRFTTSCSSKTNTEKPVQTNLVDKL
jgi:hypothetical protein